MSVPTLSQPGLTSPGRDAAPFRPLPGRGLGIAGFVLSLLAALAPIGLVMSLVSLRQGRRAGYTNGFAVAGVVIGFVWTALLVVCAAATVYTVASTSGTCSLGDLFTGTCG